MSQSEWIALALCILAFVGFMAQFWEGKSGKKESNKGAHISNAKKGKEKSHLSHS